MAKYQNEGLNIIAEKYPDIDFSDVDGNFPISVGDICDKLNIELMFDNDMNVDNLGKIECIEGRFVITANERHSFYNNIFTIAHELGHYILHKGTNNRYDEYHRYTPEERAREYEANDFAAKLLMPVDKFVESFHRNNGILLDIAYEFGVSVRQCEFRAFNLGLIIS